MFKISLYSADFISVNIYFLSWRSFSLIFFCSFWLPLFPPSHSNSPPLVSTWGWLSIKHGQGVRKRRRRRQMEVKEAASVLLALIPCASIHIYIYCSGYMRANMEDDCRWSWRGHVCLLICLSVWCSSEHYRKYTFCFLSTCRNRKSTKLCVLLLWHLKFSKTKINKREVKLIRDKQV